MGTNLTKEEKAFLDTIAWFEGTMGSTSANGYDKRVTGIADKGGESKTTKSSMNGWTENTDIRHGYVSKNNSYQDKTWYVKVNSKYSTAAGRYQFIGTTWANNTKNILNEYNAPMTKDNQNIIAMAIVKKEIKGSLTKALTDYNEFTKILNSLKTQWSSFEKTDKYQNGWTLYKGAYERYKQGVVQPPASLATDNDPPANNKKYKVQSDEYFLKDRETGQYELKIFKGLTFTVDGKEAKSNKSKYIQLVDSFGSVTTNTNVTDDNGNLKEAGTLHYNCGGYFYVKLANGTQMVRGTTNKVKTYFDEDGNLVKNLKNKLDLCSEPKKSKVGLPIKVKGSYNAKGLGPDALHSFDRRTSDKFGGYMFMSEPVPSKWADRVKVGTQGGTYAGKGVNTVLADLISKGVKPKVSKITINIDWSKYAVSWEVTIDESSKNFVGVKTRGSIGTTDQGVYSSRADGQIPKLKTDNPDLTNWTSPTIVYNGKTMTTGYLEDKTNQLRQYFLAYTKA